VPVRDSKTHRGKAIKKKKRKKDPFNLTYWCEAKREVEKKKLESEKKRGGIGPSSIFIFLVNYK